MAFTKPHSKPTIQAPSPSPKPTHASKPVLQTGLLALLCITLVSFLGKVIFFPPPRKVDSQIYVGVDTSGSNQQQLNQTKPFMYQIVEVCEGKVFLKLSTFSNHVATKFAGQVDDANLVTKEIQSLSTDYGKGTYVEKMLYDIREALKNDETLANYVLLIWDGEMPNPAEVENELKLLAESGRVKQIYVYGLRKDLRPAVEQLFGKHFGSNFVPGTFIDKSEILRRFKKATSKERD